MDYRNLKEIMDASRLLIAHYEIKESFKKADAAIKRGNNALNALNNLNKNNIYVEMIKNA